MGLSRLEFWRGLPFPSPGNLPNPEIKATSLTSPALAGGFFFLPLVPLGCSNHDLLIAKFRLKLKKVGKAIRPFTYDLSQISYDYTMEATVLRD